MIRISIIDDSPVFLTGENAVLSSDPALKVISTFSDGEPFKAFMDTSGILPDIVILDVSPEHPGTGLAVAGWLQERYQGIKVIIFSQSKRKDLIVRAVLADVRAYLAKDSDPSELLRTVHSVYEGNGFHLGETIPPKYLIDAFGDESSIVKGKPQNLNRNELAILNHTAKGLSSKEIAVILDISPNTVDTHKERIRVKLGAKNIIEAIVITLKKGIISLSDD